MQLQNLSNRVFYENLSKQINALRGKEKNLEIQTFSYTSIYLASLLLGPVYDFIDTTKCMKLLSSRKYTKEKKTKSLR